MSPAASSTSPGPRSSPLRCTASTTRSPLVGDHAREDRLADQLRARRDHDLGDAELAREQLVGLVLELVLLGERAGVVG